MLAKFILYIALSAATFGGSNSRDEVPPWLKHRLGNVANIQDTLYQGVPWPIDQQVFEETFNYTAQHFVLTILFRPTFPCKISHIYAQAFEGGRPILLKGGVGYRFFWLMFKSRAGKPLKGQARAYCRPTRTTTEVAPAEAGDGDNSY